MKADLLLIPEVLLKKEELLKCSKSDIAGRVLELLFDLMNLVFKLDKNFRRNIENFNAQYFFTSVDKGIAVVVNFADGKMEVKKGQATKPNIKITFKDSKAMYNFLLSGSDLLSPILHQDVMCEGNLNYLNKFGYMCKHLAAMVGL